MNNHRKIAGYKRAACKCIQRLSSLDNQQPKIIGIFFVMIVCVMRATSFGLGRCATTCTASKMIGRHFLGCFPSKFPQNYDPSGQIRPTRDTVCPRRRFHPSTRCLAGHDGDHPSMVDEGTTLSLKIPTVQDTEEVGALFGAILLGDASQLPEGSTIFLDG